MVRRRHGTIRTLAAAVLGALLLVGCGSGGGGEAEAIARDACALFAEVMELDFLDEDNFERFEEMEAEFTALEQRQRDAELSDQELEDAVESECPDVFSDFEDF